MDIGLLISFILVLSMVGFALYLHAQQNNVKVDKFEQVYEEQVYDHTKFNPDTSQHIGWLQTGNAFDNLILYFDIENAKLFALTLDDNINKIFLDTETLNDGETIQVNGKNYTADFFKEQN